VFCHECGAKFAQPVKFCSSCGTAQGEHQKPDTAPNQEIADGICPACSNSKTQSGAGVCADCTQRNLPPKMCQNCGKKSQREGLPVGQISAYPNQNCEFCGYNYFVPKDLARVLATSRPEVLSSTSLEWLFFAAWNWAGRNGAGYIPMIDVDDRGMEEFNSGNEIPPSSWTEMYWGGEIGYCDNDLLPVMKKYSNYPQLWYSDQEYFDDGEGGTVSIHCYPRWQTSMTAEQETVVRESIQMTSGLTGQDALLKEFISKLI
jgi:hypothetical protein